MEAWCVIVSDFDALTEDVIVVDDCAVRDYVVVKW